MKYKLLGFCLSAALMTFPAWQQADELQHIDLPDMGDSSGTLISPAQEKELGEEFFRQLHTQVKIDQDAEIQQYIQTMGHKLVANSDAPTNPFHFFVVVSDEVNAFAGPSGYIGVNSGLILMTEAESELASVVAHEVAHVTQRHLYRAFEAASKLSIPAAAATLAAILIGTQNPTAGQAALMAIQAGAVQFQIDFTRDNEQEADRVGMQTLVESDYDPRSMPTFFERLQQSTRYAGTSIPEFLRTHPVTVSRISDTRGRADQYAYRQYPDSTAYLLAKAKLRVLTDSDMAATLKYFQTHSQQGTEEQRAVARYGIALTYLKNQQLDEANTILQELLQQYPEQPYYLTASARVASEAKNYPQALDIYQKAAQKFPHNDAIKIEYITALLKAGQPELARQNLESLDAQFKKQPLYFELLAQSYGNLQQKAESHRYLAEYYYAIGDTQTAVLQIKLAQQEPTDFYLKSVLTERLVFFLAEEKQRRENE